MVRINNNNNDHLKVHHKLTFNPIPGLCTIENSVVKCICFQGKTGSNCQTDLAPSCTFATCNYNGNFLFNLLCNLILMTLILVIFILQVYVLLKIIDQNVIVFLEKQELIVIKMQQNVPKIIVMEMEYA